MSNVNLISDRPYFYDKNGELLRSFGMLHYLSHDGIMGNNGLFKISFALTVGKAVEDRVNEFGMELMKISSVYLGNFDDSKQILLADNISVSKFEVENVTCQSGKPALLNFSVYYNKL